MARRKKVYDDDDGRTIADMSGLSGPQPMFLPGRPVGKRPQEPRQEAADQEDRPWEKERDLMSKEDRRMYILGALKAALLIALAFIVGLGACIALLIWLWS